MEMGRKPLKLWGRESSVKKTVNDHEPEKDWQSDHVQVLPYLELLLPWFSTSGGVFVLTP